MVVERVQTVVDSIPVNCSLPVATEKALSLDLYDPIISKDGVLPSPFPSVGRISLAVRRC